MASEDELKSARRAVWDQAKALAERRADKACSFTPYEQAVWDGLMAELDVIDGKIGQFYIKRKLLRDHASAALGGGRVSDPGKDGWRSRVNFCRKVYVPDPPAGCWQNICLY